MYCLPVKCFWNILIELTKKKGSCFTPSKYLWIVRFEGRT